MTMKGIKKYLFMLMALAAVFGFVACSDNDDDDYVPLPMAVYKADATNDEETLIYTLTFLSNGSFTISEYWKDKEDPYSYPETYLTYMGTYTGKPAEDDEIVMTITHLLNDYDLLAPVPEEMKEYLSDMKVTISDSKFTLPFVWMAEFVKQ